MPPSDAASPSSNLLLIVRNALSAYGSRALLALSVLVLTPFLFRELGAGGFGTWSVILVMATVYSLVEIGFARGVSKVTAELLGAGRRNELNETLGTATTLLGGLGVLAAASAVALALFGQGLASGDARHAFREGMLILALERLLYFPMGTWWNALTGYQRYDLSNLISALNTVGFTVAAIAVVEADYGVVAVTIAFSAAHFSQGILAGFFLKRIDPEVSLLPRLGHRLARRRLTSLSSYVLLAESMTFIGQRMDTLVIASIRTAAAAAPYAAALKLQTGLQSLTLPVVYQLMPMASDLWSRERRDEVLRRLALAMRITLQVTLPVALALALFSGDVVDLWLGIDAPEVTERILVVLMIVQVVMLAASPAEQVLVGIGRVRPVGLLALVEGVSNLGVSIVLVTQYGAIGAAVGTLVTSGLIAPIKIPLAARALRTSTLRLAGMSVLPAVASTLPAIAAMVAVRLAMPHGTARFLVGAGLGLSLAIAVGVMQIGPGRLRSGVSRLGRAKPEKPVAELGAEL